MDDADRAQLVEEREREAAIRVALIVDTGDQVMVKGRVICAACGDPLDPERLRVLPDATRCVPCKTSVEAGQ